MSSVTVSPCYSILSDQHLSCTFNNCRTSSLKSASITESMSTVVSERYSPMRESVAVASVGEAGISAVRSANGAKEESFR